MKWMYSSREDLADKKWFFCVDDDTWINVPSLLEYISGFPESLPLSFSHIYLIDDRALYNGGAGMLSSQEAFHRIGWVVYRCMSVDRSAEPLHNDNILAACAYATGVLIVLSSKFCSYSGTDFINPIDDAGVA